MKILLLFLIFALVIPAQAYASSSHMVTPSGSLAPGTHVTASIEIRMDISGTTTFPENNTLQLVTDLVNESWQYWVFLDNTGSPHPVVRDRVLQITSWELTYRSEALKKEYVRILLEGDAPGVQQTKNITVFDLMELDPYFNIIEGSKIQRTAIVASPADIKNGIAVMAAGLENLKTDIQKKRDLGADVSRGELKYLGAQQQINLADNVSQSLYITGLEHLSRAENLTREGFKENDKAWAQKTLNDAEASLERTDVIIANLQTNMSFGNETMMADLIKERRDITNLIASAKTEIQNGNFERARSLSNQITVSGNQSYTDAVDLKKSVDNTSLIILCVIAVSGVCLVSIGVIIVYRVRQKIKKKKEVDKSDVK